MILKDAQTLALLHMEKYKIANKFNFEFEDVKSSLGRCFYFEKRITLSKWYVEENSEEEVEDTILHEIAHALAWINDRASGHGKIWKSWAKKVGANPSAVSKHKLIKPKNHHKYEQECCGVNYQRHRISSKRKYYCPKCEQRLFLKKTLDKS